MAGRARVCTCMSVQVVQGAFWRLSAQTHTPQVGRDRDSQSLTSSRPAPWRVSQLRTFIPCLTQVLFVFVHVCCSADQGGRRG